jgi:K(+)-stimulated pyrophosphate-energized sodium pump
MTAVGRRGHEDDRRDPPSVPRDPGPARRQGVEPDTAKLRRDRHQGRARSAACSLPGVLAVVVPVVVGFTSAPRPSAACSPAHSCSGVMLLALFMANAGGAWDNAKKYIEKGNLGGKGSDAHKAAVVGDTVGDPFKDTAGPAMNILIKLMPAPSRSPSTRRPRTSRSSTSRSGSRSRTTSSSARSRTAARHRPSAAAWTSR